MHAKFIRAIVIRRVHVRNKFNIAIVIPIIRVECTTHRNCSLLFHTGLRRKIDSRRESGSRHGQG